MRYLISSSGGNDSVAMIQLAYEKGLRYDVHIVHINTGWAAETWEKRVLEVKGLTEDYGFFFHEIKGHYTFESLITERKSFPMPGRTWCSYWLKGEPFNDFTDIFDPSCQAIVCIGKRRDESPSRRNTPEWLPNAETHNGRTVWHMLAHVTEGERNELIERAGLAVLSHRSRECDPCVNANRSSFVVLSEDRISRVESLEKQVNELAGKTNYVMFRPHHHMGAKGIREVVKWARSPRGKYEPPEPENGCDSGLCE